MNWPASCSPTCAASTASWPNRRTSSPPWSGIPHQLTGPFGRRHGGRRHRGLERPRRDPVPRQGSLRRLERHRPGRGLRRQEDQPAVAAREPAGQPSIYIAAVTQIRYQHSPGRAYYDKKIAEGKTGKEALRCVKRRISDAIYARLVADARTAATSPKDPEGNRGTTLTPARPAFTPNASSSDKPLPGRSPAYDRRPQPGEPRPQRPPPGSCAKPLDTKRIRSAWPVAAGRSSAEARRSGRSGSPRSSARASERPDLLARSQDGAVALDLMQLPGVRNIAPACHWFPFRPCCLLAQDRCSESGAYEPARFGTCR